MGTHTMAAPNRGIKEAIIKTTENKREPCTLKIDMIINAINENDRKQGDYIKNSIGLSDTAVIP